jgi:hypothetical protein
LEGKGALHLGTAVEKAVLALVQTGVGKEEVNLGEHEIFLCCLQVNRTESANQISSTQDNYQRLPTSIR